MADSVADKARKARERAQNNNYARGGSSGKTDRLVMDLTRGNEKGIKKVLTDNGMGRYPNTQEQRAANLVQQRRRLDTGKTAARATAIENRTAKKKAADTVKAGVSGGTKKAAPKTTTSKAATFRAAAGKPMAKPATKAPAKPTKAPAKKKVVQMPSKISPSKMTPAQKAKYLQNPERYDG